MSAQMLTATRDHGVITLDPVSGAAAATGGGGAVVWTGTVFPALAVVSHNETRLLYPRGVLDASTGRIEFEYDGEVRAAAILTVVDGIISLDELTVTLPEGDALADVYFGLSPLTADERDAVGDLDVPEWPDWRSLSVCVPGLNPSTATSIARRWDLGQADVALGAFGPASGTPYGAAFPRPTYVASFGDDNGWILIGATDTPAAQASLMVRATSFALRWSVRDDLWGARSRVELRAGLRLVAAASPVEAYHDYVASFDGFEREERPGAFDSSSNTWGDFRHERYDMDRQIDTAIAIGARVLVIDDGWETEESSGIADESRLGDLDDTVARAREQGLDIGFWQSVGWIRNPHLFGLTADDLIVGADGVPVRTNWALDPRDDAKFLIDPTTPGGRGFLLERTRRLVSTYEPAVIKLDFAYAYPSVARAVPRDPHWRGERLSYQLCRMIADEIRDTCPKTTVLGYTASPFHAAVFDVISMDDMGDAGFDREGENHSHWSVWGAALGLVGIAVSGSGGYNADQDAEAVLNTAVLGATSSMLSTDEYSGQAGLRRRAQRRALARWHRRNARWRPMWLNSELGAVSRQPRVVNWGRLENHDGVELLTALVLRESARESGSLAVPGGFDATSRCAIIAQDDADLRTGSGRVAVIAVSEGDVVLPRVGTAVKVTTFVRGEEAATTIESVIDGRLRLAATPLALENGLEGWEVEGV